MGPDHRHPDTDAIGNANPHTDRDTDADTNGHSYSNSYSDANADPGPERDANRDADADCNADLLYVGSVSGNQRMHMFATSVLTPEWQVQELVMPPAGRLAPANMELFSMRLNEQHVKPVKPASPESGFSLIEVVIALLIVMIGLLSVAAVFTFAITQNAGNKSRAQALSILQLEAETIRAAKFNGTTTDADLLGGVHAQEIVTADNGNAFLVDVTVDNEPLVAGVQDETYSCLSPQGDVIPCALKEITITVSFAAPTPGWQTAVPAVLRLRRVRGN